MFHYLYDIPSTGVEELRAKIATIAAERGLDARLEPEKRRISHRERAQRAADRGGGDFVVEGPWAAAVGAIPGVPLRVFGRRHDYGAPVGSRWKEVWIEVAPGTAESAMQVGYFLVDYGLVLLADADGLSAWRDGVNLDGLFDVAFWGGATVVERAARELGADPLPDGAGWRNLPETVARERLQELKSWREAQATKLAVEVRPHTQYYRILEQIRQTRHEVGTLELGGATIMGLSTSWGDGAFPVWVDRDAKGTVLRIRLELGTEKRRQMMEQVWERAAKSPEGRQ